MAGEQQMPKAPALIDQPITNRWSGEVQFTAKIAADPSTPFGVRIGLAVKWAIQNGADLRYADLRYADLRYADLRYADLRSADLRSANLRSANLTSADLRSADLRSANLTSADLTSANLRYADLRYADLTSANLRYADLRYANLRYANLRSANLRSEKISRLVASVNRSDGYSFFGFELEAGGVKISAGCRWFTPAEFRAHIAAEYPNADKAKETGRILDFIEGRAEDLGIVAPAKAKRITKKAA